MSIPKFLEKIFNLIYNKKEIKALPEGKFESSNKRSEREEFLKNVKYEVKDKNEIIKEQFCEELQKSSQKINLENIEKKNGVEIITLNGQNFNMLVHNSLAKVSTYAYNKLGQKFEEKINPPKTRKEKIIRNIKSYSRKKWNFSKINKIRLLKLLENRNISTSNINQDFLGHAATHKLFNDEFIIYGYDKIKPENIRTMGTQDLAIHTETGKATKEVKVLNSPDLIENTTDDYNEVVIKNKKPDCIVCFDEINEYSLKRAKQLNIPIRFIDSKAYANKQINNIVNIHNECLENKFDINKLLILTKKSIQFVKQFSYNPNIVSIEKYSDLINSMWERIKDSQTVMNEGNLSSFEEIYQFIDKSELDSFENPNGQNYIEYKDIHTMINLKQKIREQEVTQR